MVASHWDRKGGSDIHFGERQNDVCVGKQGASVLEFRLDLGLGQGQNTRLSIIVIGQPPNRPQPQAVLESFWEYALPFAAFPIWVSQPLSTGKDSSLPLPDRSQGARQEARGQLHCLDGFPANEHGSPWTEGPGGLESNGSQRVGQGWASEHEQQAVPPLRRSQSTPDCPPKQPSGGRGQPVPWRVEDERLDRPGNKGHKWPAVEKDLNKTPTRQLLQTAFLGRHSWFSGRILASHPGDWGSIPGQCIIIVVLFVLGFPGGSEGKESIWGDTGDLGWEDPLEKEMATHSSILAWIIPWTEECYSPRDGNKSKETEQPEENGFQVPEGPRVPSSGR